MLFVLIIFILIFSFLIISHELGHFLVAKKLGIKIEEFGIGFPPRIFDRKIGETIYSVNWIPFGGFVRIYGESPDQENLKDPRSFANKSPKQKSAVLLAGVAVNFLVATILFYFLLGFSGFQTYQAQLFDYEFPFGEQRNFPIISMVAEDSPAYLAGIRPFYLVLKGNGEELKSPGKVISFVNENKGEEVSLLLKNIHTREEKLVKLVPRLEPPEGEGAIGVAIGEVNRLSYNSPIERILSGPLHSLNLFHFSGSAFGYLIRTSIKQRDIEPISRSVSGPVGILAFTKMSIDGGVWQVFYLIAAISLALAAVNILPIPAADGGRMMFVLYEAIAKKRAPAKVERSVNTVGFFILLILFILITFNDIIRFKDVLF